VKSRVKRIAVLRTDGYSCEFDSEKLKHYKPHTQGILVRQTSRLTLSGKSENTLEQDIFEFVSARYEKQRNVYAIDIINHLGIGRNILNLDTLMGAEVIPDPLRSGDSQETLALQLDHNVLIPKDIVMALSHFHII